MQTLQEARLAFKPPLPSLLSAEGITVHEDQHAFSADPVLSFLPGTATTSSVPKQVGVLFSGGPAPGGHNVIVALFDTLLQRRPGSKLWGFLSGARGLLEKRFRQLERAEIDCFRNQPGFDLLGSGRTKIATEEQRQRALEVVQGLQLDALVIIGGDDSNTNAWILSEYFKSHNCSTQVVGVPKTIDGDLKNAFVEISFGFDTACRVYAELIGNIARDARSSEKYTHFIKLMGRSASHVTLECALQTQPNLALIGEEIWAENRSLEMIIDQIADLIEARAKVGRQYGVILIPEGLLEFIPEMRVLLDSLNHLVVAGDGVEQLDEKNRSLFQSLPAYLQKSLLEERDSHGNIPVSQIATEQLLLEMVASKLETRSAAGGVVTQFRPLTHFFGYEGRCAFPTNFDATYCAALGVATALLIESGVTGYMACVRGLTKAHSNWVLGGIPLNGLIRQVGQAGSVKRVIERALVDLKGPPFAAFARQRDGWKIEDAYRSPGPIQFFGPEELSFSPPMSLRVYNDHDHN